MDKREEVVGVCVVGMMRCYYYYHYSPHHHLKKDKTGQADQLQNANTQSCPLLCLALVASRRTPYAAKHWHSGTACRAPVGGAVLLLVTQLYRIL